MAYIDSIPNQVSDLYDYPIGRIRELELQRPDIYRTINELWKFQCYNPIRIEGNRVHMFGVIDFKDDAGMIKDMNRGLWRYRWDLNMDTLNLEETIIKPNSLTDFISLAFSEGSVPEFLKNRRLKAEDNRYNSRLWYRYANNYRNKNHQENIRDGYVRGWECVIAEAEALENALSQPSILLQFPFSDSEK